MVFVLVLQIISIWNTVDSYCIMFGECHYDPVGGKLKNCYYEEGTKVAQAINKTAENYEEAITQLKNYCSYFFYDDDGNEKGEFAFVKRKNASLVISFQILMM